MCPSDVITSRDVLRHDAKRRWISTESGSHTRCSQSEFRTETVRFNDVTYVIKRPLYGLLVSYAVWYLELIKLTQQ